MINKVAKHIKPMLKTLEETVVYFQSLEQNDDYEIITDTIEFVSTIIAAVGDESIEAVIAGNRLTSLLKTKNFKDLSECINTFVAAVNSIPLQYKVVFLPYYDNTWFSLESIYEAFTSDPMFITEIVIIPINRNTPNGCLFVYEDYLTPQGIPNTYYEKYSFEADEPDIVFYNNPYEGVNTPKFYTQNYKRYVGLMVYVPYYVDAAFYRNGASKKLLSNAAVLSGHINADIIIVNGNCIKDCYINYLTYSKMVALGSPKTDKLIYSMEKNEYPKNWDFHLTGKCVLFCNTHYTWFNSYNSIFLKGLQALFNYVLKSTDLALIWRPHPQTFLMVKDSINPEVKIFHSLLETAAKSENIILDTTTDMCAALVRSDIILSGYSSIITESLFLDKPMYFWGYDPHIAPYMETEIKTDGKSYYNARKKYRYDITRIMPCMEMETDELTEQEFVDQFIEIFSSEESQIENLFLSKIRKLVTDFRAGIDIYKEERNRMIAKEYVNIGQCGVAIHNYIKQNVSGGKK